jgi:hypothetical protein
VRKQKEKEEFVEKTREVIGGRRKKRMCERDTPHLCSRAFEMNGVVSERDPLLIESNKDENVVETNETDL